MPTPSARHSKTIRVVAFFEAFKGALVLVTATGLLSLMHRDVVEIAATLIRHAHLNPASRYPQIFLDAAANLSNQRLLLLAAGAALYSAVRLVEAYGLYFEKAWAEVLAALSGAIYVPLEVEELLRRLTWHGVLLLIFNLVVVTVMVQALRRRRSGPERGTA